MELHEEEITGKIIGAAIEVHRILGPGLLESVYEECLAHELILRGDFIHSTRMGRYSLQRHADQKIFQT